MKTQLPDPFLDPHMVRKREQLLRLFVPSLHTKAGKLLYVGAGPRHFECGEMLSGAGHEITVLEIWPAYLEALKKNTNTIRHFVQGDVRELDSLDLPHDRYDYSMWWHGPEHIEKSEFEPTVEKIEAITDELVVFGCPWGESRWPAEDANPHMEHKSIFYPKDFSRLGYCLVALWPEDRPGSHIMAWKRLSTTTTKGGGL